MLNKRAQNLVNSLPDGFEAALILSAENRFYFLDFDSEDAGSLLVLPDRMVYIIDSRYIEVATDGVKDAQVVLEQNALQQLADILKEEGVQNLYVENRITVGTLDRLRQAFDGVALDATPTLNNAVNALRAIKDEREVARMKRAQEITDACFTHILPFIKEGVREIDLMLEMEHYMRSHGAEKVAFDTICVAGPNTSRPHGVPGTYRVRPGDFITMDFGAKYEGYCTDMTRTVAFGDVSEEQRKVYDMVLRAHLAGIDAVRGGVVGSDVDKVARNIIYGEGYEGYFGHGLGHAVGIEIHEDPRFSPLCNSVIEAGMMMTVEPGCYLPGRFGCRIEDTVLVTQTGCQPLPKSDKSLLVL